MRRIFVVMGIGVAFLVFGTMLQYYAKNAAAPAAQPAQAEPEQPAKAKPAQPAKTEQAVQGTKMDPVVQEVKPVAQKQFELACAGAEKFVRQYAKADGFEDYQLSWHHSKGDSTLWLDGWKSQGKKKDSTWFTLRKAGDHWRLSHYGKLVWADDSIEFARAGAEEFAHRYAKTDGFEQYELSWCDLEDRSLLWLEGWKPHEKVGLTSFALWKVRDEWRLLHYGKVVWTYPPKK